VPDTVTIGAITPTSAVIATDEVTIGGTLQQVQRVKLVDGTDGGTELLAGSAAFGLAVDLARARSSAVNSGSITTATSVVGPYDCSAYSSATVAMYGTFTGVTAVFEVSADGTNWFGTLGTRTDFQLAESGPVTLATTNRAWDIALGSFSQFRVRSTAWASGTASIQVIFGTAAIEPQPAVGIDVVNAAGATAPVGFFAGSQNLPVALNNIGTALANVPATRSLQALAVAQSPNFQAAYGASTQGVVAVPVTASTTTSILYLWHPSGVALRYELTHVEITVEAPTTASAAGQSTTVRLNRITAENGTPGGTTATLQQYDPADAASGATVRIGATGAPTRGGADVDCWQLQTFATNIHHTFVWDAQQQNQGKGLVMRASQAEGWEVRVVTNATAIGSALNVSVHFTWKEI
jgi:hypothetical protein